MMHPRWPISLLSTHLLFNFNLNILSASPITLDDNHGLYPSNPPPSTDITTNLTAFNPIYCISDRDPRRLDPVLGDCNRSIFDAILVPSPSIDPRKFYDWSYNRGTADLILPDDGFWRYKTCAIAVRNMNEEEVGTFSLEEVGFAARDVVRDCVWDQERGPPLPGKDKGGWSRVGVRYKGFFVEVWGVPFHEVRNTTGAAAPVEATVQRAPIPGQEVDVAR